jgi:chromosome segregation ATPase
VFDILDTPNGKLLKALCDYGCKIGVSSRGSGDIVSGIDGDEVVPDTYDCECFDAVLVPAVEGARPDYVTESLDSSHKQTLSESLNQLVDSANEKDKPVILETLNTLHIDISQKDDAINIDSDKREEAVANGEADIISELQEALKVQKKLESKVTELQEKLSVCYAKEIKSKEEIEKMKGAVADNAKLTEKVEAMRKRVSTLTEKLEEVRNENSELLSTTKSLKESMLKVVRQKNEQLNKVTTVESREKRLREKLNEAKTNQEREIEEKTKSLRESVAELKKDIAIKESEYSQKIERSKSLVEKYKKIAETATNRYIRCQAMRLNVSENDIRSRLSERSSFDEIDKICESLQNYVTVSNKLPFDTTRKVRVKAKEQTEPILPKSSLDDYVDDSLMALAKFNKN